jgi:hypothetical protein
MRRKGTPPPCNVAWKADVNRQKSRHQCSLSPVALSHLNVLRIIMCELQSFRPKMDCRPHEQRMTTFAC